jgi:putative FmdB family regulatory protein
MPTYCYKCESCNIPSEAFLPISRRNQPPACPFCHKETLLRDMTAERAGIETDFSKPVYSEGLGVHPSQIAEAKARFPHHNFASDGRMIIRSSKEVKRVRRDLGWDD